MIDMKFDKSRILTCVTADQAKAGDIGWITDTLAGIRTRVERGDAPKELTEVLPADYTHRFKVEGNAHNLFYPAPYEFLQEQWVKENNLKAGDKVRIIRRWEDGERGYAQAQKEGFLGATLSVSAIRDIYIETDFCLLPYFALEKVKDKYRPFANAEEFAPYRDMWFKTKEGGDSFTRKVEEYCYDGVKIRGQHLKYICFLDKYIFADTGEPAGVKL